MGFDVKITTTFRPLDLVAPFTCRGCGRLGELFCECCKNYILQHRVKICPRCRKAYKVCLCSVPTYALAYREGVMLELVEDYKYKSIRRSADTLAEMLDKAIPYLEDEVLVVPLPTIAKHIRERGFDHTKLLVNKLCKRRKEFKMECLIERAGKSVQVGTNAKTRAMQAKKAYKITKRLDSAKQYLLVDDVWTTGASMEAAIAEMKKAGAARIASAVLLIPR